MRDLSSERYGSRRSPVLSTKGMVATSQPLASSAAAGILGNGGTAADAAVAAAAVLQVTQPCSTGLGGDAFFTYYEAATRSVFALNGSGRSPARLDRALLRREGFEQALPRFHPHTVTVPGAPRAWQDLHDRFGVLPRESLVAPAVDFAEDGFPVSPLTSGWWRAGAERQLAAQKHGDELLIDGRGPRPGERMRIPTLAESLRVFGRDGAQPFYTGGIAREIVAILKEAGSVMSESDLSSHRSEWVEPIEIDYHGVRVLECPPNGQGLAALVALNVLCRLELPGSAESRVADDADRARAYHFMIEAMRVGLAEAHRFIADPQFVTIPVAELLSPDYGILRAKEIRAERRAERVAPSMRAGSDTVYFCVVDGAGNACSFINSNYVGFGTGIVPKGCGFTLQNRGAGFSLDPNHPNRLEPGKRPYHTIIPGLALRGNGSLLCPFGVMGGFMQPQGHLQVMHALVDDDLDPQAVLDRPRFFLEGGEPNGAVLFESESDPAVAEALANWGHPVKSVGGRLRSGFGLGQIIVQAEDGVLWGGSDPRGDGAALPAP